MFLFYAFEYFILFCTLKKTMRCFKNIFIAQIIRPTLIFYHLNQDVCDLDVMLVHE